MILHPHAKINLQLRITGRREDGYHTLDTVFLPVSLYDTLEAEQAAVFSFSCSDPSLESLDNLAVRAYEQMKERFDLPPVRVRLTKRIPSQAGLGGGSADAACMLLLLNDLFSLELSRDELAEIAAPLGADVPSMLYDQPMRGLGTGEILSPLDCPKALPLVIVKPPAGFSTLAMFRAWDKAQAGQAPEDGKEEIQALIRALAEGNLPGIAAGIGNDLEKALSPEEAALIGGIKNALLKAGALGAGMSGSGSAVFGLFENTGARDAAVETLRPLYPDCFVTACEGLQREDKYFTAILAAGGTGTRFGGGVNKILRKLDGKAILQYSLEAFLVHPRAAQIVIACRGEDRPAIREIIRAAQEATGEKTVPVLLAPGGESRQESVRNALKEAESPLVLIQDAARPYIRREYIDACLAALKEADGCAAAVPSRDTVKMTDENGYVTVTTERARTFLVQTPQGARREALLDAYTRCGGEAVTDDCSLLEKAGYRVKLVPGGPDNIKITFPEDLE